MRRFSISTFALALLAWPANAQPDDGSKETPVADTVIEDPYLWLEDVEGDAALGWVREQNERSLGVLEADSRFGQLAKDTDVACVTAVEEIEIFIGL